ncbi:MAG: hypothetical protein ACUVQP_01730, partial [Bacteroidales bacterium]
KILVFSFLVVFSSILFAQSVEMDWGNSFVLEKNLWYKNVIGSDKDGYYVIKSKSAIENPDDGTYLEYFSNTTNVIETSNQIIMPIVNGIQTHFFDMFYINQNLILLTYADVSSQRMLYIQYLNPDGTLKNKPKDIGSIPLTNAPKDNFKVKLIDGKIAVLYHNTFASYNNEDIHFKLINAELREELNVALKFPLVGRSFDIVQFDAGKTGYLYFLTKCLQEGKKKPASGKSAEEKYEYIMLSYNTKRKEFAQFNVKADKYVPSNVIFGLDNEEYIYVAGFFANKTVKFPKEFMGAFYMKINPRTQKIEVIDPKKSIRVFSKEFMAECSQKRNGTTPEQYYNYVLKNFLFFDNGGFAVIAEQEYVVGDDIVDPATKKVTHIDNYYFNDLIVFGVTKDGTLAWNIRIAKNQYSPDDKGFYHSYAAFSESNKIKIVYNDNKANLNNKEADKTKQLKNNPVLTPKGLATIVSIFPDGSFEKYSMFQDQDQKNVIIPKMIYNTGKRYVTCAQDGRSIKFGSFTFE